VQSALSVIQLKGEQQTQLCYAGGRPHISLILLLTFQCLGWYQIMLPVERHVCEQLAQSH